MKIKIGYYFINFFLKSQVQNKTHTHAIEFEVFMLTLRFTNSDPA